MRKSFVLLLVLLVLLPVVAVTAIAIRLLADEQQRVDFQLSALVDGQLQGVNDALSAYLVVREQELQKDAAPLMAGALADAVPQMRAYARNSGHVRQVLRLSVNGDVLYPSPKQPLSNLEKRFLKYSQGIWRNSAFWASVTQGFEQVTEPAKPARAKKGFKLDSFLREEYRQQTSDPKELTGGWFVWDWGDETHWLYWVRKRSGEVIGFEIEPSRLLADLIAYLPATTKLHEDDDDVMRVRIVDTRGSVWYQWGEYRPQEGEAPLAVRPLVHPLAHWQLEYYGGDTAALAGQGRGSIVAAALGFAALLLLLLFAALYQYRREARLAAQRVNFVNQVSHELKTPLTNIQLYAELLEDQIDEPEPRRLLAVVAEESQRLSRLIANVLTFGRAERRGLQLHKTKQSADAVLQRCAEHFGPALANKKIALQTDFAAAAEVYLDSAVLEQVVNNLLSNVEKYAPAAGCQLTSRLEGKQLVVDVCDSGPGIARKESKKVFQAFYRVSNKLTDGISGAGLGLSISAELAALHGGELQCLPVSQGCHFRLILNVEESN